MRGNTRPGFGKASAGRAPRGLAGASSPVHPGQEGHRSSWIAGLGEDRSAYLRVQATGTLS